MTHNLEDLLFLECVLFYQEGENCAHLPADWSGLIHQSLWSGNLASVFALHNIPFTILHLLECPCVTSSVLSFVFFVHCVMSLVMIAVQCLILWHISPM